jgi:hypothetical protein
MDVDARDAVRLAKGVIRRVGLRYQMAGYAEPVIGPRFARTRWLILLSHSVAAAVG